MTPIQTRLYQRLLEETKNEKLLWHGFPRPDLRLTWKDILSIPGILFICAFIFYWEYSVINNGIWLFAFFGLIMVAFVLYAAIGRWFHEAWMRRHTIYGVTDRRVVALAGNGEPSRHQAFFNNIRLMIVDVEPDGAGTIQIQLTAGNAKPEGLTGFRELFYQLRQMKAFGRAGRIFNLLDIPEAKSSHAAIIQGWPKSETAGQLNDNSPGRTDEDVASGPPDERVVWTGRPATGFKLRSSDFALIPMYFIYPAVIVGLWFVLFKAKIGPDGLAFKAFMAFILISTSITAVYVIFGRHFHDAWLRKRITYLVSDRRIVLTSGSAKRRIYSIALGGLESLELKARKNGAGSIYFRFPRGKNENRSRFHFFGEPALEFIPDARQVHDLIEMLRAGGMLSVSDGSAD